MSHGKILNMLIGYGSIPIKIPIFNGMNIPSPHEFSNVTFVWPLLGEILRIVWGCVNQHHLGALGLLPKGPGPWARGTCYHHSGPNWAHKGLKIKSPSVYHGWLVLSTSFNIIFLTLFILNMFQPYCTWGSKRCLKAGNGGPWTTSRAGEARKSGVAEESSQMEGPPE